MPEGSELELEYKHHIEANYIFAGEGEAVNLASSKTYPLEPGWNLTMDKYYVAERSRRVCAREDRPQKLCI
ncbi:ectoine synthase [Caballeronia telluris]|uniref:ectoine synthase n=1 Tax=Caballeronia telluris TaxID=326475 RepID=UPI000B043CAB|nr:ectoine synthase [Caballeronia telluris]